MQLYPHQKTALEETKKLNRVAYFHDMGLGKTFTGGEKLKQLGAMLNLVICQKSKIDDWITHFITHYPEILTFDLTDNRNLEMFISFEKSTQQIVGIINYELAWRRPDLLQLEDFTLMLDESSLIQNEKSKRSKFILKMNPKNVILLSGTPTGGKYERLWSQMRLLGWNISRKMYWDTFVNVKYLEGIRGGRGIPLVTGYKNVERLKRKMGEHGARFLKTSDVFDLPQQTFTTITVPNSKEYKRFHRSKIVTINGKELVGDTTLTKMLYERQLCGVYSVDKIKAFNDLLDSTDERLIVFYNFNEELEALVPLVSKAGRKISKVNGGSKNLEAYEKRSDSVTFVQYQAGAMGLNLQKANKLVYFSPPLSSELYEQSKKRIHRIGQGRPCFYYQLTVKGSVEEKIYEALAMRQDYTEELFRKDK